MRVVVVAAEVTAAMIVDGAAQPEVASVVCAMARTGSAVLVVRLLVYLLLHRGHPEHGCRCHGC